GSGLLIQTYEEGRRTTGLQAHRQQRRAPRRHPRGADRRGPRPVRAARLRRRVGARDHGASRRQPGRDHVPLRLEAGAVRRGGAALHGAAGGAGPCAGARRRSAAGPHRDGGPRLRRVPAREPGHPAADDPGAGAGAGAAACGGADDHAGARCVGGAGARGSGGRLDPGGRPCVAGDRRALAPAAPGAGRPGFEDGAGTGPGGPRRAGPGTGSRGHVRACGARGLRGGRIMIAMNGGRRRRGADGRRGLRAGRVARAASVAGAAHAERPSAAGGTRVAEAARVRAKRRVLPRALPAVAAVAAVVAYGLSCTSAAHAQARSPAQDHAPAWSSRSPQELLDVVRAALAAHPSLVAAVARADAAEALAREASAQRLPHLSADWAATRFAEPMIVAPLHGFDPQRPPRFERVLLQGGVTLGYTLFDGGARGARIGRAESLADAAAAGSSAAQQSLVAEVARAYLRVRAAQEVSEAHERRVQAVMRERERAAQLFDIGRTAQVTLLRAEAALSAARADRT